MNKFDKANKMEEKIRSMILEYLESKQDVEDAKEYFEGMSINDFIDEEAEYIDVPEYIE